MRIERREVASIEFARRRVRIVIVVVVERQQPSLDIAFDDGQHRHFEPVPLPDELRHRTTIAAHCNGFAA